MEYGPFIILATSLLGVPMIYFVNSVQEVHGEAALFIVGTVALAFMCIINYIAVRYFSNVPEPMWLILAFVIGTFASSVDLMIGLEADGLVSGFMTAYLKKGEPYLGTPYGAVVCYWDGIGHYLMYAVMLSCMALKKDYRLVGLFWAGSIGHSMLVLIGGAVIGKFGARWAILLNVPYMCFPFMAASRFLNLRPAFLSSSAIPHTHILPQKSTKTASEDSSLGNCAFGKGVGNSTKIRSTSEGPGLHRRPLDLLLCTTLVLSMLIALFRGAAVLECGHDITRDYITYYEPYLRDPIAHPKVQMLVYLFYFVPFYILAIRALVEDSLLSNAWLTDWSLLAAGAAAQAQIPHLFAPFKSGTSQEYRIPEQAQLVFLAINIFLLIQPQILALRCVSNYSKHCQSSNKTVSKTKKEA